MLNFKEVPVFVGLLCEHMQCMISCLVVLVHDVVFVIEILSDLWMLVTLISEVDMSTVKPPLHIACCC